MSIKREFQVLRLGSAKRLTKGGFLIAVELGLQPRNVA